MGNTAIEETPVLADAMRSVRSLLPNSWRIELAPASEDVINGPDKSLLLIGDHGESIEFAPVIKDSTAPSTLLLARLRALAATTAMPLFYVSEYIGPSLREALAAQDISYADATGWVRVASEAPLVLLTGQGAETSPRARGNTAITRLNGIAASRIIRSLCAESPPIGVRNLAAIADVSPGSVSKLLPTLVEEGIVERDRRGAVLSVRRRPLIRRWARDYSFAKTNKGVGYYVAPRGIDRALARLRSVPAAVTLTGSAAARRLLPVGVTPVVPLRFLALYARDPGALVDELELFPAEPTTANTILASPQDPDIVTEDIAPTALVLADLLTLPGRGDAEAEQLMDALARTDESWEA